MCSTINKELYQNNKCWGDVINHSKKCIILYILQWFDNDFSFINEWQIVGLKKKKVFVVAFNV